jgi:ribosomal protein L24
MSDTAEPETEIKAGDLVLALDGVFKGKVGTALRVVSSRDEGRTSCNVLVSFPSGGADYLSVEVLEKADVEQSVDKNSRRRTSA